MHSSHFLQKDQIFTRSGCPTKKKSKVVFFTDIVVVPQYPKTQVYQISLSRTNGINGGTCRVPSIGFGPSCGLKPGEQSIFSTERVLK